MNTPKPYLYLGLFLGNVLNVFAASWVVWPGESLQSAIDNAAPGDNITVQSGSYPESIVIDKGLDIRASGGVASFTGNLTITEPTLPVYLADLYFGTIGGVGITITGVNADVRMDRCQLDEGGTFTMTEGELYLYKCTFTGDAQFSDVDWTTQRTVFDGTTLTSDTLSTGRFIASEAMHLNHDGGELTIFQSQVTERAVIDVSPGSSKAWLAYSTFRTVDLTGAAEVVGNHFDMDNQIPREGVMPDFPSLALTNPGGTQVVRNNVFFGAGFASANGYNYDSHGQRASIRVRVHAQPAIQVGSIFGTSQIVNNTIDSFIFGIKVEDSPGAVEVRGNYVNRPIKPSQISSFRWSDDRFYIGSYTDVISSTSNFLGYNSYDRVTSVRFYVNGASYRFHEAGIYSEHDQAVITNNSVAVTAGYAATTLGGIQSDNGTWAETHLNTSDPTDPNFFQLDPASAGVDAGLDHPLYTDLDGSRNDVGAYGGHSYDPTGRTTTKPVILSGEVTPLFIKRGSSATIEARAAVVAEP